MMHKNPGLMSDVIFLKELFVFELLIESTVSFPLVSVQVTICRPGLLKYLHTSNALGLVLRSAALSIH